MTTPPPIKPAAETNSITNFLIEIFAQAKKTTAIVAVSGGLDSATSLLLTVKALTPTQVYALFLPSKTTPPSSHDHVQLLIKAATLDPTHLITLPISGLIQKSWRTIKRSSTPANLSRRDMPLTTQENPPEQSSRRRVRVKSKVFPERQINQLRLANLAARLRMTILFDQAKKLDALVVGTENLSEHLLGYYTRFGDEASDLEPLRHLYKTQVITLAQSLGVPQPILDKPPSADLWSGQTDASELGFTYTQADPVLYLHRQGKTTPEIIANGSHPLLVEKVLAQVHGSAFKHQVPYHLQGES